MSEILYVVAPYWAQAPVSVHRDPDKAIRATTRLSEGCRVVVIDPATSEWRTTEAPHLIDLDDPHHVRERLAGELRKIGNDLTADD